jgi:Domain of unknown function (DUF4440)
VRSYVTVAVIILLGLVCGEPFGSLRAADTTSASIGAADRALGRAVAKTDRNAAAGLLDDEVEWTDLQGRTLSRKDLLEEWSSFETGTRISSDEQIFDYGRVGVVSGSQGDIRFQRVWVKRHSGWRIFNSIETVMKGKSPVPPGGGDCDNPCKTLPYKPASAMDVAILDAWQKAKNDEWHPNASDWALRVADEFLLVSEHALRTKAERVALLERQQKNAETGPPGDPIESMRMFDFGNNAAVMLSQHVPYRGGKPYRNVRVWILRDQRWQLAASQQTTITSAAPVQAVNAGAN